MTKLLVFILSLVVSSSALASSPSPQRDLIVLVPGLFNSMVHNYFSAEIIETLKENSGRNVYVARTLLPTASLTDNGDLLGIELRQFIRAHHGDKSPRITLVGHSSGGLYALRTATRFTDLNIDSIYCISTPFEGDELADRLFSDNTILKFILSFSIAKWIFPTEGFFNLTTKSVREFIAMAEFPRPITIFTIAGSQPRGSLVLPSLNARKLNILYSYTSHFLTGDSDGMVSTASAFGKNAEFKMRDGMVRVIPLAKIAIDHTEQHLDPNYFRLIGTQNIDYIRDEQRALYSIIARNITNH